MIGKYREGTSKPTDAFKAGIETVFPEIMSWSTDPTVSGNFMGFLYGRVRSGLYHVGMPNPSVIFINDNQVMPAAIRYYPNGTIFINPDNLVKKVEEHFASYASELRNPTSVHVRANFERRYESDNP